MSGTAVNIADFFDADGNFDSVGWCAAIDRWEAALNSKQRRYVDSAMKRLVGFLYRIAAYEMDMGWIERIDGRKVRHSLKRACSIQAAIDNAKKGSQ